MDFDRMTFNGFRPEPDDEMKHPDFSTVRNRMSAWAPPGDSDLRPFSSPRHQQSHSGSCAANAVIKGLELERIQKYTHENVQRLGFEKALEYGHSKHVDLSRLALYYLARELMNPPETNLDEGTYISLCADVLRRFGVCREAADPAKPGDDAFWPFDLAKIFVSPSWKAMRQAYVHKIDAWYKIYSKGADRVEDVIQSLAAGNPVAYGTLIGENWRYYDGTPLGPKSGKDLGGHATLLVGWDSIGGFFWGENSWGEGWGPDDGFYKIRPEVIQSTDSSDFIVLTGGWEPWVQKVD
jgi:hypothetical protein